MREIGICASCITVREKDLKLIPVYLKDKCKISLIGAEHYHVRSDLETLYKILYNLSCDSDITLI